jgi:hypothetical protein
VRKPEANTLSFMQVDLDDYTDRPNKDYCNTILNPEAPVLRMYGVTMEGHSVLAHIHDFSPYFYCPVGNCEDAQVFEDSLEIMLKKDRVAAMLKKNVRLTGRLRGSDAEEECKVNRKTAWQRC